MSLNTSNFILSFYSDCLIPIVILTWEVKNRDKSTFFMEKYALHILFWEHMSNTELDPFLYLKLA